MNHMHNKFVGSLREIRTAVIKLLNTGEHGDLAIARILAIDERKTREVLATLAHDGIIRGEKGSWSLA
jgi:hypothetical protein